MPLVAVPAIYDGEHVSFLEQPPVHGAYSVVVTFVEPVDDNDKRANAARFWASYGAWQDDRPAEVIVDDLRMTPHSRHLSLKHI